jgi:isocitrate dehydrogenase
MDGDEMTRIIWKWIKDKVSYKYTVYLDGIPFLSYFMTHILIITLPV